MATTTLQQMIDPDVIADMLSAQVPLATKFDSIAPIDDTLQNKPGDVVTVPRFGWSGPAVNVSEGQEIPTDELTTQTDTFTVQKVAKALELTDESLLSGLGDPMGESIKQIAAAMAAKLDDDRLATALKARLTMNGTDVTKLDIVDEIEAAFIDDTSTNNIEGDDANAQGILFMNPKDVNALRKAAANNWDRASQLGDNLLSTGVFGGLMGWQIVRSRKIKVGSLVAVKPGAMKTYLKRDVNSETERVVRKRSTYVSADAIYGVAIADDTKILVVNPFDYAAGSVIEQNVTPTPNPAVKKANKGKQSNGTTAAADNAQADKDKAGG